MGAGRIMFFLTPRYLKQARLLHKGVTRFINYKRDLLPHSKLTEICALKADLEQAIKARNEKQIDEISAKVTKTCQGALPDGGHSEIADNVEVFFVAIVVALGIRAYIAQPFKIPTGSMQPTLNGYIARHTDKDEAPVLPKRVFERVFLGRSYVNVVSKYDGYLRTSNPITENTLLIFFTYSTIHFEDGRTQWVWGVPVRQLIGSDASLGFAKYIKAPVMEDGRVLTPDAQRLSKISGGGYVSKGQLLARGILERGDHVLVNKFAYNFRTPKRGEVFVFVTKHITGIEQQTSFIKEHGAQHYIKRLVAVPGDQFQIKPPEIWINGKPAEEFGPKRVASLKDGYQGYFESHDMLRFNEGKLEDGQYLACGDNSANSLDSRWWGPVPERNLVGPALFSYLPFGKHWGPIW